MPVSRVVSFFLLVLLLIVASLFDYGRAAVLCYFVVILFTVAGMGEFYGLAERKGARPDKFLGIACGFILTSAVFAKSYFPYLEVAIHADIERLTFFLIVIAVFSNQLFKIKGKSAILSSVSTLVGVVYVSWLFSFVIKILYLPGLDGRWYVFFLFLVTKGSDTCAYLVGRTFGRNQLISRISPGKTREGFIGGLAGAIIGGLIGKYWFGQYCVMPTLPHVLFLSAIMGLVAVPGDLFESLLKRDAGVKDVAGYLPGLGGVLDVIDSILFTAPILYFYLVIFTP